MNEKVSIAIGILVIALLVYGVHHFVRGVVISIKQENIVRDTSKMLKKLDEINSKIEFHCGLKTKYVQKQEMSSKQKYDYYHSDQLCDEILLDKSHPLQTILVQIIENRKLYDEYSLKVRGLKSHITQTKAEQLGVPYDKYCEIEKRLFSEKILTPTLDGKLVCVIEYTSPARRNHYSKSCEYSYIYLIKRTEELQALLKKRESAEFMRKIERSKMTLKMRMAVLERDGWRCQICGARQEDGATLHVDHIVPLAQGGKTEMSNLQTLCDMCNLGKRDRILQRKQTENDAKE